MIAVADINNGRAESLGHIVILHARRSHKLMPRHADLDELTSAGWAGAIEALRTFKPDGGSSIDTWASMKIRSRIGRKAKQMARRESRRGADVSIDCIRDTELEPEAPPEPDPRRFSDYIRARLAEVKSCMPGHRRDVLRMYYEEGFNQVEIGVRMGLSESRVSQIRRESIKYLQTLMA